MYERRQIFVYFLRLLYLPWNDARRKIICGRPIYFLGVSKLYYWRKGASCSDALFEVSYLFGLDSACDSVQLNNCPSHCRNCACIGANRPCGTTELVLLYTCNKVWQYELKAMIVKLVIFTYMTTARNQKCLFLCLSLSLPKKTWFSWEASEVIVCHVLLSAMQSIKTRAGSLAALLFCHYAILETFYTSIKS